MPDQGVAERGRDGAAIGAVEQSDAEIDLQILDQLRRRRLGDVQVLCRVQNAGPLSHGDQQSQLLQLQAR